MTSPLRQRQRRAVEQQISAAALALFSEKGVQATTVEDIARAAEVSVRTVLRYYPRKEDTALLAHYELKRALQKSVDAARMSSNPVRTTLQAYADVFAEFDDAAAPFQSALERVDQLKRSEPLLLQAGLRVDAEQTVWLAGMLASRGGLGELEAMLTAETIGLLFRQTMQYWADRHGAGTDEVTLVDSFRAVREAYRGLREGLDADLP